MKLDKAKIFFLTTLFTFLNTLSVNISAGGQVFSHQYLKLELPDGWSSAKLPDGAGKESIGILKSKKIKGASITLDCYRGGLHTLSSTRIRALGTIGAAYPDGQKQLQKPRKVRAKGGKGKAELWRGYVKVGDQMVTLVSPMAALKTKHCWLVVIGFAPESKTDALQADFTEILHSAQ